MKTFLKVPYAQNDEARRLGAKWDLAHKSWYVEDVPNIALPASQGFMANYVIPIISLTYVEMTMPTNPFPAGSAQSEMWEYYMNANAFGKTHEQRTEMRAAFLRFMEENKEETTNAKQG